MAITIRKKEKIRGQDRRTKLKQEARIRWKKKNITDETISITTTYPPPESDDHNLPCLPCDLVLYNILPRLPLKSLLKFRCVCKLWYHTIDHDVHLPKNAIAMFHFFNLDQYGSPPYRTHHYFYLKRKEDGLSISKRKENGGIELRLFRTFTVSTPKGSNGSALIGCCNGLVCLCVVFDDGRCMIRIFNPSRCQVLNVGPPINVAFSFIKGYGFGFDILTKEYKVVCIIGRESEYYCVIYKVGDRTSWRTVTGPGPCVLKGNVYEKPAVFCDGALFWKIDGNPFKLLSFDFHEEKFDFIEIPFTGNVYQQIWVHYLEYRGCLCFASLEEFENHSCKIHLLILKDRMNEEWVKETLLVPFSCEHTTRIVCFSNEIFLYWFFGEYFIFYDPRKKVSNLVKFPCGHFSTRADLRLIRNAYERDYNLYTHVGNPVNFRQLCSGNSS